MFDTGKLKEERPRCSQHVVSHAFRDDHRRLSGHHCGHFRRRVEHMVIGRDEAVKTHLREGDDQRPVAQCGHSRVDLMYVRERDVDREEGTKGIDQLRGKF